MTSDIGQVVKKFAEQHAAVLKKLEKTASWGDHQVEIKVEMLAAKVVDMSLRCRSCGSWMRNRHIADSGIDVIKAAAMMVESFTGFHEDDCEEARRVNIVRDVMTS
ncbi:hypothetical protein LCGC14_2205540 [marine sediment metagenome]|uniref:Uncharacterized protein n=1 Tax=marine sediment metagenome TaxID=412755 RepID=A0A0F9FSS0_9ZZZZ